MTKILDQQPIPDRRVKERFGVRYVRVKRHQILIWVGIDLAGVAQPAPNLPVIPALLDTGSNFEFSIQHRHLQEWAGIDLALLTSVGSIEINEQVVARYLATIWLYPNLPGQRTIAPKRPPVRLRMDRGIAIYGAHAIPRGPRLPLVGLPALLNNDLDFWLDPEGRHAYVQTRTWRRTLMRLLSRF
jgi:hypothetical protein